MNKKRQRELYGCAYLELKNFLRELRDQYGLIVTVGVLTRCMCDAIELLPSNTRWLKADTIHALEHAIATVTKKKSFIDAGRVLVKIWTRR